MTNPNALTESPLEEAQDQQPDVQLCHGEEMELQGISELSPEMRMVLQASILTAWLAGRGRRTE